MARDGPVRDDGGEVVMSKLYPWLPKSAAATATGAVGGVLGGARAAPRTHHARAAMHHPAARALAESPPHHASRPTPPRVCRQGEDGPRRPRAGRWRRGGDEQAVPLAAEVGGGNCDGCGRGGALGTRARHAHTTLPLFVGQCTPCLPEPSHSTHLGHPAPTHPHHLGPHAHAPMCRS